MESDMEDLNAILGDQKANTFFKVAVIDGHGEHAEIDLRWEDSDGEYHGEIPWPKDWPEWVTVDFLCEQGFRVITA